MDLVYSINSSWELNFISHLPVIVIRDLLLIIFNTVARKARHANQCQPMPVKLRDRSARWKLFFFFFYLIRIYWLTAPVKSFHVCGSAAVAGCWSLFSSHLFSLLCPRLPGISPTFTISSATKTCNNSDRRRQPNKYFSERLAKTHNPTDSDKGLAKLRGQIVRIVCIGLRFVMPVISPVCYNGIPCHLKTFVKKGQIHSSHSRRKHHVCNCMGYESCCVKLLSLSARVCLWMSIKGFTLCTN